MKKLYVLYIDGALVHNERLRKDIQLMHVLITVFEKNDECLFEPWYALHIRLLIYRIILISTYVNTRKDALLILLDESRTFYSFSTIF